MSKKRLDVLMVERGLAETRSQAQALILAGLVPGHAKAGEQVDESAEIQVEPGPRFVSRGGEKLAAALDAFGFDPKCTIALDVGASTGGFSDVLIARGAAKIYAVDVGSGQLHAKLRVNPRVVALEGTDARALDRRVIGEEVTAIVADVSFISLTQALPAALKLAAPGAWLVALVKPQFEAGRAAIGKGGIVRDPAERKKAVEKVRGFVEDAGWTVVGEMVSPILGGSGNEEFLIGARHGA